MENEEYFNLIEDTTQMIKNEKRVVLSNSIVAFKQSNSLVNDVEFWKWMGRNYPNTFQNTLAIQESIIEKPILEKIIQGKAYEWEFMKSQRNIPSKILSSFHAGDCPTQPGIDIIETNILDGKVVNTYQAKAYTSNNSLDLKNAPSDTIIVSNAKKQLLQAEKDGFSTKQFMTTNQVRSMKNNRISQAIKGRAETTYTLNNVSLTSVKAGIFGAIIGMTNESLSLYHQWKDGKMSDSQYVHDILVAGGDIGTTAGITSAIMIPIQATITAAGMSNLITLPITILINATVNNIIAPCFGRGKYKKLLGEAKYYQNLNKCYEDFISIINISANQYYSYLETIIEQHEQHNKLKEINKQIDMQLKNLYDSI